MGSHVRVNDAPWLVWYDGGVHYVYPCKVRSIASGDAAQSQDALRYYQDNGYLDASSPVALRNVALCDKHQAGRPASP